MKSMAKLLAAVCIAAIAAAPAFARVERFRPKDGTGIEVTLFLLFERPHIEIEVSGRKRKEPDSNRVPSSDKKP